MDSYDFPYLELGRKKAFEYVVFSRSLNLPERVFPQQFKLETKKSFCGGYFVTFNKKVTPEQIHNVCERRDWNLFTKLIGDFFVIYCDFVTHELFIYSGQSSAFPCYFSIGKEGLVLSSDLGLLSRKIKQKTLNIGSALDFIFGHNIGERTPDTVINQIKQLPPGALLKINKNFSYSIEKLVDFDSFYSQDVLPHKTAELFVEELLSLLSQVIKEQLNALGSINFIAELSSGFDSGLICYLLKRLSKRQFKCFSSVSSVAENMDPKDTIEEFSMRHGLDTYFLDVTNLYPFFSEHDLWWTEKYFFPSDHGQEEVYRTLLSYKKSGAHAFFSGYGGDEIYKVYSLIEIAKYILQFEFFDYVKSFKHKNGYLLTKKAAGLFLSRDRFKKKNFYPSVIPTSATSVSLFYFPIMWKLGCWQLTPFTDPRVVKLALKIPRVGKRAVERNELFRDRNDIFIQSQFKPKVDAAPFVGQFLKEKKDRLVKILNESTLGRNGWVKSSEIIKDLEEDNIGRFLNDGNLLSTLHNLVRLEYFIQKNNIEVKS